MNCYSCQAENDASALVCSACGASLAPTAVVVSVDLSPGILFHSRYEILGPLGRGGMGMVYKAHDKTLDEIVAIKVLRPDFAQDPKMAQRFKSEIKLARKVRHKNVCTIHDYGEERGLLFISMEFIDGTDLRRVLKPDGGLPWDRAYDVAIQVAEGLQAVHDAGIIHRDLKTPNIMLDPQGLARLMDFGVAKQQNAELSATATGAVVGTPEYMSPEQARGLKLDARSDIYALGIVIYEIFTGQVPFRGETPISTILMHLHDPPPLEGPPAEGIPRPLRPVLTRALAKEAADRHSSASALAEALRHARSPSQRQQPLSTDVLEAPTLTTMMPPVRARALQPWLLVVLLASVGVGVVLFRGLEQPATPAVASLTAPPTTHPALAATGETRTPETRPAATAPATTPPQRNPVTPGRSPVYDRGARDIPQAVASPARAAARPTAGLTTAPPPPASPPLVTPLHQPSVVVPPTTVPVEASAAQGTGLLQVAVRPWAKVGVDGRELGTTPLDKISLSIGTHNVRLEHPLYEPMEKKVAILPGQTEKLVFDFSKDGVRRREP